MSDWLVYLLGLLTLLVVAALATAAFIVKAWLQERPDRAQPRDQAPRLVGRCRPVRRPRPDPGAREATDMSDQPHLTTAYTPQALEELLAGEWNTIAINAEMLARICPLCNAMVPIDQRGFRYKEHHTKFHVDAMRREQERR